MNIGTIRADNISDPKSEQSIRLGYVIGEGYLGTIFNAGVALAEVAENYGYICVSDDNDTDLQEARLSFFYAIKALEEMVSEQECC